MKRMSLCRAVLPRTLLVTLTPPLHLPGHGFFFVLAECRRQCALFLKPAWLWRNRRGRPFWSSWNGRALRWARAEA